MFCMFSLMLEICSFFSMWWLFIFCVVVVGDVLVVDVVSVFVSGSVVSVVVFFRMEWCCGLLGRVFIVVFMNGMVRVKVVGFVLVFVLYGWMWLCNCYGLVIGLGGVVVYG